MVNLKAFSDKLFLMIISSHESCKGCFHLQESLNNIFLNSRSRSYHKTILKVYESQFEDFLFLDEIILKTTFHIKIGSCCQHKYKVVNF